MTRRTPWHLRAAAGTRPTPNAPASERDRAAFEHRLFLSATPHNGYAERFSALLELLDPSRFARTVIPTSDDLERVMVRRMKSELPPYSDGRPRFPTRVVREIAIEPSERERAAYETLSAYLTLRSERADEGSRTAAEFIALLLKRRFLSSPRALLTTLAVHRATLERVGSEALPARASRNVLQERIDRLESGFEDDAELEDALSSTQELANRTLLSLAHEEARLLDDLRGAMESAVSQPDSRAAALIGLIEEQCRSGGVWGNKRLLVFAGVPRYTGLALRPPRRARTQRRRQGRAVVWRHAKRRSGRPQGALSGSA